MTNDVVPPSRYKAWVSHLQDSTVGQWSVTNYHDDTKSHSILIFNSTDTKGALLSTVGLMDVNISAIADKELRTEILLDHRGRARHDANVLATIAFYVLKNKWRPTPGAHNNEQYDFTSHPEFPEAGIEKLARDAALFELSFAEFEDLWRRATLQA